MAITMQGSWTLRVKSNNAAVAQRFIVSGATTGNGSYDGVVGNAVFVTGTQWSVSIQHQLVGQAWCDSAQRIGLPGVNGGLLRFDIESNANGLDVDYDNLVLACSLPASRSDHVVYGMVKTYSGACLFNPLRDDYIVIDPPFQLGSVCTRYPQLGEVIKKLYPERLHASHEPLHDPAPDLTPIVIPTGLPHVAVGLVFESCLAHAPLPAPVQALSHGQNPGVGLLDELEAEAVCALQTTVKRVPFKALPLKAGVDRLLRSELQAIADIRDAAIRFRCQVEAAPGLLLRFQRYNRTATERLDGPYTGTGEREDLGLAVTDEQGRYLIRFNQVPGDVVGEANDAAQRPDVIVQLLGSDLAVSFETAPYDNIANLRRIDLCVPHAQAHPDRSFAGDRVIQRVGGVGLLHSAIAGAHNGLDADGRITTCCNAHAPQVESAGWRGTLRLYARFDNAAALHYAVYFKRPSESLWNPVMERHALNFIPHLVAGGISVGPCNRSVVPGVPLHGGGGPAQPAVRVPTYVCREGDLNWIERDLKLVLNSRCYRPRGEPGTVQFRIEAYDREGQLIETTVDTVNLYIDNRDGPQNGQVSRGHTKSIQLGGTPLDEINRLAA